MEFNFNSFGNSKQTISYCEVDKCKAVIKYKQAIEKIKEIIHFNKTNRLSGGACISIEQILQICDEVNKCENQ